MAPHISRRDAGQPLAVLVVDHNPAERTRLGRLLRRQLGKGVTIREALEILRTQPVDVALVDQRLPDMEGAAMLDEVARSNDGVAAILMEDEKTSTADAPTGPVTPVRQNRFDGPALAQAVHEAVDSHRVVRNNARIADQLARTEARIDHFLRAISHDMGANFLVMENSLRQLKRSCGEAPLAAVVEAADHMEACLRESKRFLADLAQLSTTGTVSMTPQRVDLADEVRAVLFEQKDLIVEQGAVVEVSPALPVVWCNPTRVRQVLTNLVRNALRHGCDPAAPRIAIGGASAPAGLERPGHVWLAVEDNGSGVPARFRQEIFLPGKRLAGAADGGSGMGLAIVQRIIDHYGGAILVDADCVGGARFVFSLPAAPSP